MTNDNPLVTINIVTRNRVDELCRAIESAHAQTYRPIEIVVVDNDSSDGSVETVMRRWPEIHMIQLHRNTGCQPGRNIGMKNSRGKYIYNLDDDGALDPNAIERIVARFEAEPDVALVSASVQPLTADKADQIASLILEDERYVSGFPGGASALRRDVLPEVGYFPEYPRGASEQNLGLRILDRGYVMVHVPNAIMYHAVSAVERSQNEIMFYSTLHRLQNRIRLDPWSRCFPNLVWKATRALLESVRRRAPWGFLAGLWTFFWELPRVYQERRPVSSRTTQLADWLAYEYITTREQYDTFNGFTMWQAFQAHRRGQHRRLKAEPSAGESKTDSGVTKTASH